MSATIRTRDVLAALFSGCEGLVEFRALPSKARIFARADETDAIAAWLRQHRQQNTYWGVSTRRDRRTGSLANCRQLGALFVDIDAGARPVDDVRAELARVLVPPSIVLGSGGGLHCYWLLREPLDVQDDPAGLTRLLRRLATSVGGDLAAAEPARILRVAALAISNTSHRGR